MTNAIGYLKGYHVAGDGVAVSSIDTTSIVPNPTTWTQANWYVDWAAGNDANDGKTPATAVKTVMGGVVAKWGTMSPQLPQTTTLHILTPQPANAEEINLAPVLVGKVNFVIVGTPVQVDAFALTTANAKDRAAGTPWEVGPFAAPAVDMLVHNTTAGKDSWALVSKLGVGGVAQLTQPLAPLTPGLAPVYFPVPAEVDTWAVGDTVVAYEACTLNLRSLVVSGAGASDALDTTNAAWLLNLLVVDASGTPGTSVFAPNGTTGASVVAQSCVFQAYLSTLASDSFQTNLINCACSGIGCSVSFTNFRGGRTGEVLSVDTNWFDADVLIDAGSGLSGENLFGFVQVEQVISVHGNGYVRVNVGDYGGAIVWGSGGAGAVHAQVGASVYNSTGNTWVATWLSVGMQLAGGAVTGTSYAAGVWTDGVALNPANLDANTGALQSPRGGARFTTGA